MNDKIMLTKEELKNEWKKVYQGRKKLEKFLPMVPDWVPEPKTHLLILNGKYHLKTQRMRRLATWYCAYNKACRR